MLLHVPLVPPQEFLHRGMLTKLGSQICYPVHVAQIMSCQQGYHAWVVEQQCSKIMPKP